MFKTFTKKDQNKYLTGSQFKDDEKNALNIKDSGIDYSDFKEIDEDFFKNAKVVYPSTKKRITIRIDEDVLEYYKSLGQGYQTKINEVLKYYAKHHQS
jgi:uncharacterized protein (DUF4415 family)